MAQCYAVALHTRFIKMASPMKACQPTCAPVSSRSVTICQLQAVDPMSTMTREYSSYFWGAILGQTRSGKQVLDADVDKNGQVSLGEAHAYAVVG